jgi:RimJ/RimL family protein N-acetyltransferase
MPNIALEPFQREDFDRLIRWVDSPELTMIWSGTSLRYPLDHYQLQSYLESGQGSQPIRQIYRVVDRDLRQVVGHIELNSIDRVSRAATVSRVLVGKEFRGRGIASAMLRAVLAIGFDQLHLHRIDLVVFDFNKPALHVYEKNGFKIEGLLRDHRRMGEAWWSNYIMAILEDEWQARKKTVKETTT